MLDTEYAAIEDTRNKLERYPAIGDIAPSGDLGFTAGPWVYTLADGGKEVHGHFLTVWKRDSSCRWQVAFDGGVSHPPPTSVEPKLLPGQAPFNGTELPPPFLVTNDAAGQAVSDFQSTAQQDGLAAALRTYGRNSDFLFYMDGQSPIGGVGPASLYLKAHAIAGAWQEAARVRSSDSTLLYSEGRLADGNEHSTHAYVQIWQYDPKVANWGLRVLLIKPLPPPEKKGEWPSIQPAVVRLSLSQDCWARALRSLAKAESAQPSGCAVDGQNSGVVLVAGLLCGRGGGGWATIGRVRRMRKLPINIGEFPMTQAVFASAGPRAPRRRDNLACCDSRTLRTQSN